MRYANHGNWGAGLYFASKLAYSKNYAFTNQFKDM
jgi:hypothetical protein